jgi:hypothetical protein
MAPKTGPNIIRLYNTHLFDVSIVIFVLAYEKTWG